MVHSGVDVRRSGGSAVDVPGSSARGGPRAGGRGAAAPSARRADPGRGAPQLQPHRGETAARAHRPRWPRVY